jgi:hypothetical protein
MQPLDYGRSFLIGTQGNEVRFWVESRTRIVDEKAGTLEDYFQAASCKSEDTLGSGNLFYEDNYDFLPIFGPGPTVVFRRKVYLNPGYKQIYPLMEPWGAIQQHLVEIPYEEVTTTAEIIAATKAFRPLVAQTEIWDEGTRLRAIMEYPVKTINTTVTPAQFGRPDQSTMYQTDTGPVAFFDVSQRYARFPDGIGLAFVAFSAPDKATFVIEVPTPVREQGAQGKELCQVHHYMKRLLLPAKNRLYAAL